jgi:hypothetical protein
MNARLVAFYLPQFHPIPENDAWWGKGFTEWFNVAQARPLFEGHYQPHIPGDLGFYDLRLSDTRIAQAELAQQYGIEGFCYWHYWFQGKRLLERPFNEVLASGEPRFPFCLAWANESWSRRWLGEEKEILEPQKYSAQDDVAHARWLARAFADPRYLRVNGRPLFLIYRPRDLPAPQQTLDTFRLVSVELGVPEPYIVGIDAHCFGLDLCTLGFDDTLAFEPQLGVLPNFTQDAWQWQRARRNYAIWWSAHPPLDFQNHPRGAIQNLRRIIKFILPSGNLKLYDDALARQQMDAIPRPFSYIPSVYVGWDNTPRRSRNGVIISNGTAEGFRAALQRKIRNVQTRETEKRFVFLNAWNEWAEGNHLEPDLKVGHAFLRAVHDAVLDPRSNWTLTDKCHRH